MKRIIALLLCCMLWVSILPMHASAINVIEEVEVTIDEPAVGNAPQYNCKVKTEGCAVYKFEPVMWFDKTEGRYLQYGDYFQEGHAYSVQIWVAAKTGYQFSVDAYDNIHTTGKINHHTATVYKAYEQDPEEVIELYFDFGTLVSIHTCTPWPVARVEPTCTENGHESYYHCTCGMNYADAREEQPVDINSWGIIPATGHTESGWRTTQVYHYTVCTSCGDFLKEEDHYGGAATCTEKAKCSVCGYAYGREEPDHRWGPGWDYKDSNGHAWVCADCKAHSDIKPHTPGPAATEKDPQICRDCGYIIEPAKDHTHELTKVPQTPADCTHGGNIEYYFCVGCNDCFTDAEAKNKIPEHMSVEVGALGHTASDSWSCDGEYHWRKCTNCSAVLDETRMLHEAADGKCTTCGYVIGSGTVVQEDETSPTAPIGFGKGTKPSTGASSDDDSNDRDSRSEKKNTDWVMAAMVGLVCFGASITATVIILKKKKK